MQCRFMQRRQISEINYLRECVCVYDEYMYVYHRDLVKVTSHFHRVGHNLLEALR